MGDQQEIGDPIEKLYGTLYKKGYYTKSLGEFKTKYSNPEAIDKLYEVVNRDGLYTKTKDDFSTQYFAAVPVKKKISLGSMGSKILSPGFVTGGGNGSSLSNGLGSSDPMKGVQGKINPEADERIRKYNESQGVAFDENDPVKSQLIPVENKIAQQRQFSVADNASSPVSRASKSITNTQLSNAKKEIENLKFNNSQEAAHFLKDKLDPAKLSRKGDIDITRGGTLDDYTEESIIAATPKDNMTANVAAKQYLKTRKAKEILSSSRSLEDAAIKTAISRGDLTSKQLQELGSDIPRSMKGAIMLDYLNDETTNELSGESAELTNRIRQESFELPRKYPETAIRILSSVISAEREGRGENNGILNITGAKTSDKIVDDLVESGDLPVQYKQLYDNPAVRLMVNMNLKTPGLIENVGTGLDQGVMGIGKSVAELTKIRDLYMNDSDKLFLALDRQYKDYAFKPKGLMHQISTHGGLVTGQVLPMMAGGTALRAMNIVKGTKIANAIMVGMQTFGENRDRALVELPGESDNVQLAKATIDTGIEMALSSVLDETKLAKNLIKGSSPEIKDIVKKFTSKEISESAAKESVLTVFDKLLATAGKFSKGTVKTAEREAREETATQILQTANNQIFGGEKQSVQQQAEDAFEVWRTTFLGSLFLGAGGGVVEVNRNPTTPKLVYEMASNPEKYIDIMKGQAAIDPEYAKTIDDKLNNLQYAVDIKKELDGRDMKEGAKEKFLLKSLSEKMLTEKAKSIPDKSLAKDTEKQLAEISIEKEKILNPDMGNKEFVQEFYDNDLLPKGAMEALEVEGKFNEQKVGEFLKGVAQQANNLDANWKPNSDGLKHTKPNLPDAIIEAANERWAKEIEAAQPKVELADQVREVDNGMTPKPETASPVSVGGDVKPMKAGKHELELSDFHDNHEQIIKDNPDATITLYHGTINEIKDIKDDRTQGLYFTPSIKEANDYNVAQNDNAAGEYGHIYKVTVPLKDLEITNDIDNAKKGSKVYYSPEETYFRIDNPKNYKVERVDDAEVLKKFDNPKAEIEQTTSPIEGEQKKVANETEVIPETPRQKMDRLLDEDIQQEKRDLIDESGNTANHRVGKYIMDRVKKHETLEKILNCITNG